MPINSSDAVKFLQYCKNNCGHIAHNIEHPANGQLDASATNSTLSVINQLIDMASELQILPDDSGRLLWCNTHERRATHRYTTTPPYALSGEPCCDPDLDGILLPCRVVDLTDDVELIEDAHTKKPVHAI